MKDIRDRLDMMTALTDYLGECELIVSLRRDIVEAPVNDLTPERRAYLHNLYDNLDKAVDRRQEIRRSILNVMPE